MCARSTTLLLAFLATTVLAAMLPAVGTARAGDDDRKPRPPRHAKHEDHAKQEDYVAKLQPKELEFLQARIKGWNKLDARKKQMIARNVVALRGMSPEQRKHFEARLKRLRTKGDGKGWDRMHRHGGRMLVDRGLARAALRHLGRDFERRLRRSDISAHVFERSFANAFWGKVAEASFVNGEPPAPESLASNGLLPSPMTAKYERVYKQYKASEDENQRKMLRKRAGYALSFLSAHRLRHELARSDARGTDAYLAAVARKVEQTWPGPFAESVKDPDALLRSAENHEVKRSLMRLLRRDGKLMREESALLVKLVERWAVRKRKDDAGAAGDADALIKRVLHEDFKVSKDALDAMPPRAETQKRAAWYLQILREHLGPRFGKTRGAMNGPRKDGRGRRPGPRGPVKAPDGISESDWRRIMGAAFKALRTGSTPLKPDGISDQDWKRGLEAAKRLKDGMKRRRK